jgi:hypothetical protein
MTEANYLIPTDKIELEHEKLHEKNLLIEKNPQIEEIDDYIELGKKMQDKRTTDVNIWKYNTEGYELFRLEFSNFINNDENKNLKNKMQNVVNSTSLNKKEKVTRIRLVLYKLIDQHLFEKYKKIAENSELSGGGKLVHIVDKLPNLNDYKISNDRMLCDLYKEKDKCNINPHCKWQYSSCSFIQTNDNIIKMVNKIAEEIVSTSLKYYELFNISGYSVSDVGDMDKFTEREGTKIIKSTSSKAQNVLSELIGKDKIFFRTGKKRSKITETNYNILNQENQAIDMINFHLQKIIDDNMNLFRAYSNCYYWIINKYSDIQIRNLGFYNPIQSDLAINFKSNVINWLLNPMNTKQIPDSVIEYLDIKKTKKLNDFLEKYAVKLIHDVTDNTLSILELFILNQINDIPIVVYDEYHTIMYIFDNKLLYDTNSSNKKELPSTYNKYVDNSNCINLRFTFKDKHDIKPKNIDAIYYN